MGRGCRPKLAEELARDPAVRALDEYATVLTDCDLTLHLRDQHDTRVHHIDPPRFECSSHGRKVDLQSRAGNGLKRAAARAETKGKVCHKTIARRTQSSTIPSTSIRSSSAMIWTSPLFVAGLSGTA